MTTKIILSLSALCLAGCAAQHESVSVEHKGPVTIVHHRSRTGHGSRDRIEAIAANGAVTQAEVHVYDVGSYVDGSGDIHEAHRLYRTVQSERPNLMLPKHVSAGPRTVFAPPNYSPMPADQRINDAVTEGNKAKDKLVEAKKQIDERLQQDNSLRGELQEAQDQNQILRDQLSAAMATPSHAKPSAPSDAEKAAQSSASDLQKWGQAVGSTQP